ncbi:MAG: SDR family oxidoreductase [Betaproteobacteria bacterium]|nr:SDR family oxidoreductase [Betaproteobacteria bacterium]
MVDVKGKVVIVTGGGIGIGKVYATRLAQDGARVVAADIQGAQAEAVARAIVAAGGDAIGMLADVTSEASIAAMVAATIAKYGQIDALVNNAGLMSALPVRNWMDIPVDEWDRVMATNLRSMFLCSRAVFPHMQARRAGSIINISSGRALDGLPLRLHYTSSKAGVMGFTRGLAREVGEFCIRVNCVTPGYTMSESQTFIGEDVYKVHAGGRAIGHRAQVPEDLVGVVTYLVSDSSGMMTGQTLNVDGGRNMR